MDSDHWLTHARGGRRWFLKVGAAGSVVGWVAGNAGWDALKWGWHALTAPVTRIVGADGTTSGRATVTGVGESITGTLNVQLEPLRLSASGTLSDPPEQIA